MAREDPQLKIRLPEALKNRIEAASAASGRSMNAEIVHRLERSDEMSADIAMVIAEGQLKAAVQRMKLEEAKALFTALADMVDLISLKAKVPLAKVLTPKELSILNKITAHAVVYKGEVQDTEAILTEVDEARKRLAESRYRFLEAKGAKGVREAKV